MGPKWVRNGQNWLKWGPSGVTVGETVEGMSPDPYHGVVHGIDHVPVPHYPGTSPPPAPPPHSPQSTGWQHRRGSPGFFRIQSPSQHREKCQNVFLVVSICGVHCGVCLWCLVVVYFLTVFKAGFQQKTSFSAKSRKKHEKVSFSAKSRKNMKKCHFLQTPSLKCGSFWLKLIMFLLFLLKITVLEVPGFLMGFREND